jgi:hypothetical protein
MNTQSTLRKPSGREVCLSLCCSIASAWSLAIAAPYPGDENWDTSFGVPGADDPVATLVTDGTNFYFGGSFSTIGGISASNLARWDGIHWHSLGVGVNGSVSALTVSGTNVYAAGQFTQAGGIPATNIACWDGASWSALGAGIDGKISVLAALGDELFAGGSFSSAGGLAISNIARWDGAKWSGVAGGINGPVTTMQALGGSLYVGGAFTQAGSTTATYVAKWHGANWEALGNGLPAPPSAMAASALYIYASYMVPYNQFTLARWEGASWAKLLFGDLFLCWDCDVELWITCLAVNGKDLYFGGNFGSVFSFWFGQVYASSIVKWDGYYLTELGSGLVRSEWMGSRFNGPAAIVATGSDLFFAGSIAAAGQKPSHHIARWRIPHSLAAQRSGDTFALSWPSTGSNFVLEATSDLSLPDWQVVAQVPVVVGDRLVVTNGLSQASQFFRLERP